MPQLTDALTASLPRAEWRTWLQGNSHYVRQILDALGANPLNAPLICEDVPTTAGSLADSVTSAAHAMRAQGVGLDSVVAVLTNANTPATLILRWAANLLGATVVHLRGVNAVNPLDQLPLELQLDILTDVRATLVAVDADNVDRGRELCDALKTRPLLAGLGAFGPDIVDLTAAPADAFDPETAETGDIAVVTYTSGSTGRPKGVSWSFAVKNDMVATSAARGVPANCLVTAPLTHSSGFAADDTVITGGLVVLQSAFDATRVLRAIGQYGITRLVLSAPQVYALTEHPAIGSTDLSTVRELFYTGSAASPDRIGKAVEVLGPVIMQVYGTSESGLISLLLPDDHRDPALRATVGRPPEGVRVTIRDTEDGRVLPPGEPGEVCVISRWSMERYWNEPELTARTVRDGWIHTGDIGHLDDAGYLHLHGRIADVIKTNGIKVYPASVERALLDHPAVAEAAVFGVEDVDRLERICAVIVATPGAAPDAEELRRHVGERLTPNHVPADIELRTALPVLALGKPDRLRLRAEARERLAVTDAGWPVA
ncbi:class I adenylate-forming enzyme family protein [Streptomyces tanashiensis]|uniref:AMP-binding protein n=1 Tax=Streptomyces tanashiensis TaxID=67367 RepID=A0ABY6QXC0_9ACTN|nr:AMP-binding protein [Streptomyces tanashiensis]UZX21134.1 AMP-binding protein [Streptomyces tanashiensis]